MIEWRPVGSSSRIVAEAYDPETEKIYVRFPNGVEWWYAACPPNVWEFCRTLAGYSASDRTPQDGASPVRHHYRTSPFEFR